jgi:hypothetical protein
LEGERRTVPVFHKVEGGALIVTVDGDFTANEVVRVGSAGLGADDVISPAFLLLDLTGTAAIGDDRLQTIADFFAGPGVPVARLAVVAGADLATAIVGAATASGMESDSFKRKADAMDWLLGV